MRRDSLNVTYLSEFYNKSSRTFFLPCDPDAKISTSKKSQRGTFFLAATRNFPGIYHNWVPALTVVVVSRLIGTALAWSMDYQTVKETIWGKLALLHIHPANGVIQTLAAVVLFYGIWMHEKFQSWWA